MLSTNRAAPFILVTIFLDAIGFGIVMPVLPRLLMQISHVDIAGATAIYGWMAVLYAAAQFFCGPIIGNLSDRFGRRPVLLAAMAGLVMDYLLMAVAQTLPLLFLGRAIGGIVGSSYGPAQAALADSAPAEERARLFGFVGAAFGIGFVVGPAIGGLLGELDPRAPFYAAALLAALNLAYGFILFPETLGRENRRQFDWRRANPLGAISGARNISGMYSLAAVLLLWQVASSVYPLTWSYYCIARFGWSNAMIGASLAAVGVVMALSQIFMTGRAVNKLGERKAALLGMAGGGCAFISYAFITQSWMAFAVFAFLALQALVQPSLMAMLSRRGTASTQGEVQGIASMVMGLGSIVAPLLLNPALAFFTSAAAPFRFSGAAFMIAALFTLLAMVTLSYVRPASASQER